MLHCTIMRSVNHALTPSPLPVTTPTPRAGAQLHRLSKLSMLPALPLLRRALMLAPSSAPAPTPGPKRSAQADADALATVQPV